tara:strand:- start:325 stop:2511 length:2187 start_codon:yes stop_codon:yes gene_type:complete
MKNFGAPVSGYVDYKFQEIGNLRRERYMDNFYMSEAMRQSAADLQAAPFEGDEAYRQQLLSATDNTLQQIAEKGDYENMTLAVNRASTEYQKRAKPLAQNKAAYDAYKENLKEQYEKGDINFEHYQGELAYSTANYKGLQMDEQGNAKNFFAGRDAVRDPDINGMLKDALNGMKADGDTTIRRVVGQGPNGMLEVETEQGIEYISPDRVDAAMQSVMQDGAVTAFIDRTAELRTVFADEKTALKSLEGSMKELKQADANLDTLIADARSEEEKQQLMDQKKRMLENISALDKAMKSGDLKEMHKMTQSIEAGKIRNEYESSARNIYSFRKVKDSQKSYYDKMYMQLQQQGFDLESTLNPVSFEGNMVQYKNPYGTSDVEASQSRAILSTKHEAAVQLLNSLPEDADAALVEQYLGGVRQIENDLRALDDYTQFRYGQVSAEVMQTPEYKELTEEIVAAEARYNDLVENEEYAVYEGSQQAYYWNKIAQLREKRLDMLKSQVNEDPLGEDLEVTFSYSNAQGLPQFRTDKAAKIRGKEIDNALKTYFEAVPDDLMIYIPGRTGAGEMVSYAEAVGREGVEPSSDRNRRVPESMMIPQDATYASHGISLQAPTPELGPTLQINYTSETKGNGSYIVPLNQAVNIPELAQHLNTPSMKVYGEIERYGRGNVIGMTRTLPISSTAGPGKMEITYREGGPSAVFISADGTRSEEMSVDSTKFHNAIERNQITI